MKTKEAISEFLNLKRIAVAGYSTSGKEVGNHIYKKLESLGYTVYAVNPKAAQVTDVTCYESLDKIPEKPEGVLVASNPDATPALIQNCADLGIKHVWIHKTFGNGSYHQKSEAIAKKNGITLIPAGCPMMYCDGADPFHRCFKWIFSKTGRIPKEIDA